MTGPVVSIDKEQVPTEAWDRLDMAIRRTPGFGILTAVVILDFAWDSWIAGSLVTLTLLGTVAGEFGADWLAWWRARRGIKTPTDSSPTS